MARKSRSAPPLTRDTGQPDSARKAALPRRPAAGQPSPGSLPTSWSSSPSSCNKRSMYPSGHPHLRTAAERFVRRMTVLLEGRDSVTLGVARHRLVIESVTTDPNNALLRDLAHRLHRHGSPRCI